MEERTMSENKTIKYLLMDNGGFNPREYEILLPVKTIFKHEYGSYMVTEHMQPGSQGNNQPEELIVICDRISNDGL